MKKIFGIVAGLAAWLVIVMLTSLVIRQTWPEYVTAAETMAFTLPMKLTRLAISAVGSVVGGWVAAAISRGSRLATVAPGIGLLVLFIPQHIRLWDKFPLWYHLTFLLTLVPLSWLGGKIGGREPTSGGAATSSRKMSPAA
jgi:hypothetical protein